MAEKRILTLRLKGKWWHQIKSGEKRHEFRLFNEYWKKRLLRQEFDEIHIWHGYPKKTDTEKLIVRKWNGYHVAGIKSEEFGPLLKTCFCIDVSEVVL